jgi:hypothetical protein
VAASFRFSFECLTVNTWQVVWCCAFRAPLPYVIFFQSFVTTVALLMMVCKAVAFWESDEMIKLKNSSGKGSPLYYWIMIFILMAYTKRKYYLLFFIPFFIVIGWYRLWAISILNAQDFVVIIDLLVWFV